MGRSVTGFSYRYPDKVDRAAAQYRSKKPQAHVVFELEQGDPLDFSVPPRVARAFEKEEPILPVAYESARDALLAVDARLCFATLVEMLSRRDHAEREACDKLRAIGFRTASIDEAVQRAREARFLDTDRFMRYFIDERKRRGWGRRKIELELARKGADPTTLLGYPEDFFPVDDELSRARSLLAKKRIPEARAFEKLVRFLMGKGFPYGVAADAVKERLAQSEV